MVASLLAVALLTAPAHADEDEAQDCLQNKVWEGYAAGWGLRTITASDVDAGKTRNYLVTLFAGAEYQIMTCADDRIKNLDVLLYDTKGNIIARDSTNSRDPKLDFKPTETGTYYIVVYNREPVPGEAVGAAAMGVVYR